MNRYSFYILASILVAGVISLRFVDLPTNSFSWDVFGYYLYLPAAIIYEDIGLTNKVWLNQIIELYNPSSTLYQLNTQIDGFSIKYTQGMAWLYLPFFYSDTFLQNSVLFLQMVFPLRISGVLMSECYFIF